MEIVRLVFFNVVLIALVAAPLLALEVMRPRSLWINRNHDWLSIVVWVAVLFAVVVFVLPNLGLKPNPRHRW
jgi:hypothetical protein